MKGLKVFEKDLKHGRVGVFIETLDDLWHLYNILSREDLVYAKTMREVPAPQRGPGRPKKGRRVPIHIGLRVKKLEFQKLSNKLRVKGVIVEAPDELGLIGSYHTLSVAAGDSLKIVKDFWPEHILKRIGKASARRRPRIAIMALEEGECSIGVLRDYGIDVKASLSQYIPGKRASHDERLKSLNSFFNDVLLAMKSIMKEEGVKSIILAGPGFTKNDFISYLKDKEPSLASKIAVEDVSSGGIGGIYEAIRRGAAWRVFKESMVAEETSLINKLLEGLVKKPSRIAYGLKDVDKAAMYGAVDMLLVADELIRTAGEAKDAIERIMKVVEDKGGRINIISTEHEAGKQLLSLGGAAAFLRFEAY